MFTDTTDHLDMLR